MSVQLTPCKFTVQIVRVEKHVVFLFWPYECAFYLSNDPHSRFPKISPHCAEKFLSHSEKQRYDGWYNNLAHPDWGTVDSHLVRKAPSAYADGVYMMAGTNRPSPRRLSQLFMRGRDGLGSRHNRTALLAFFGQVVTNEVVMASESGCPIELHRIEIDRCDDMYDRECAGDKYIPFHRAAYDRHTGQSPNAPREQINQMTAWIDGSFVYSTSEAWLNAMRTFQNGTLLTETGGRMPVRNTMRVPLFNNPVPEMMRTSNPERLFCEYNYCASSIKIVINSYNIINNTNTRSAWRSANKSESRSADVCHSVSALAQCGRATRQTGARLVERRGRLPAGPAHCRGQRAEHHHVRVLARISGRR